MSRFYDINPSPENCWRAIVLFGQNVASYKFALAKSLLEISPQHDGLIKLEEIALPFAKHICTHLAEFDKQTTSTSSRFLDACRRRTKGEISEDKLRDETVRLGFQNVIDAFHIVSRREVPLRFFADERSNHGGIRITDTFSKFLIENSEAAFQNEVEARWRLVETAWKLGVSRNLTAVEADLEAKILFVEESRRRINVTSCRDALNGYQKGKCFYCYRSISIDAGHVELADVDHFFPHRLGGLNIIEPINGVWNLVLACWECNRGIKGKLDRVPSLKLLERLSQRNDYLIGSHHPLRETLLMQTGASPAIRHAFLQRSFQEAKTRLIHTWEPEVRGLALF